jgi:MFS family permease
MVANAISGTIAWIGSTQTLVCFGGGFIGGPLFDKYGHKVLATLGTLLMTLGFVCLSFSTQYYQILLSQGVLVALGINLL